MNNLKSLLKNNWINKNIDERRVLYLSQKFNFSIFLSKLICSLNLDDNDIDQFINPNIENFIPDPFKLKDMKRAVERSVKAINKNEKIGILADYDVDGSTSAAILYNFLKPLNQNIFIKVPNRLEEGYGPNTRILDEFLSQEISIVFLLDCGTTAFDVLSNKKYFNIDFIIIDHHISESKLPRNYSLINPNRYDENNELSDLAAVGVTYLYLLALRKELRNLNFFKNKKQPNLLTILDLVALGTVCDVVPLKNINRSIVSKGLEIIKSRKSRSISTILDNSNLNHEPKTDDLGYIIGPQINAASRLGHSQLPTQLLISQNINEIDTISKKLILLNEKRKLIENEIYNEAIKQVSNQKDSKFILIYADNWFKGVLGIIASRIVNDFFKPVFIISFEDNYGFGSARSIDTINLTNIIFEAKNQGILISGGGHSMAAGLKIKKDKIPEFQKFLHNYLNIYEESKFQKKLFYVDKISINQIQSSIIKDLEILEPFGTGNEEPTFVFTDINIESLKIIKEKHILLILKNSFNNKIKCFSFNSTNTIIGEYLLKYRKFKFEIAGILKQNNFNAKYELQIILKDLLLIK